MVMGVGVFGGGVDNDDSELELAIEEVWLKASTGRGSHGCS